MSLENQSDYFPPDIAVTAQVTLAGGDQYNAAGIFDRTYAEVDAGGVGIESRAPAFLTADDFIPDLAEGDTLTINDVAYTVRDLQPDGTGQTLVILDESA